MESNRRDFLKIGSLCALGVSALPVAKAVATNDSPFQAGRGALTGKQWAMVIDMKKCWEKAKPGCKDCMVACHTTHNVPEIPDAEEQVKWLWTESYEGTFPGTEHHYMPEKLHDKPFLVTCNHCTKPACVRVCPTQATWKRSEDGIVMMDFHRCIGCRYCMAACPFGARSFNFREPREHVKTELNMQFPTRERGVVEKCNFCYERLAAGQLPACVESCKVGALAFGDVEDPKSPVRKLLNENRTIQRRPELGTQPNIFYII
ncbi:MAG: sulfate reduction electron transfer complex DsrMKJOP subunit DsrO [Acidobacteriota bacterium]